MNKRHRLGEGDLAPGGNVQQVLALMRLGFHRFVPRPSRSCGGVLVGRDRSGDSAVRVGVSTRLWIVDDDLWALIEPLLPPWSERSPGPRPVADRLCL